MQLSCHPSVTQNFEVSPGFLKKFAHTCVSVMDCLGSWLVSNWRCSRNGRIVGTLHWLLMAHVVCETVASVIVTSLWVHYNWCACAGAHELTCRPSYPAPGGKPDHTTFSGKSSGPHQLSTLQRPVVTQPNTLSTGNNRRVKTRVGVQGRRFLRKGPWVSKLSEFWGPCAKLTDGLWGTSEVQGHFL